ncbi:hypothetical protein BCR33DRAFT_744753 [Rhizoclosmatium globosum]|uniref:Uncharacterized protein n=1 Tax=Rhizoclosmatium globosum TaxID=329046 RepID=A0A1Y2B893_9FUNG|nr:hypothetical protein BCR33DRAFT_744753 [Rhizoclosmatium globosum]|eukprot:ORY30916.1 hypothetical protein BCR33DRAFT_744753 [Rhizoclosmatium globosum]
MSNPQNNPPLSNTPPERQPSSEPPSIDRLDQISQRPTRETLSINVPPPLDTTPPLYDNPPSTNNTLLAAIRMQFDKEPNFFNTRLPDRLDGKIPYNLYLARMTELNQHLNTKASLDSIKHLTRLRVIWLVLLAVSLAAALVIDLLTREVYGYALLTIPVIYGIWVPMTAQVCFDGNGQYG